MPERDPYEILRDNDPVDLTRVASSRSLEADALLTMITTQGKSPWSRRPLRIALAVAAVFLLVAATWIVYRSVTNVQGVLCYSTVDLDSDRAAVRPEDTLSTQACTSPWEEGVLTNPNVEQGEVPPFVGCVTEEGILAVFPSANASTCASLGLAPFEEGTLESDSSAAIELQDQLVKYFSAGQCRDVDIAAADIGRMLSEAGDAFEGWRIEAHAATSSRPCASFSMDYSNSTLYIIPIPEL